MPNFDGTGPKGMGMRTGRGFGPCGRLRGCGFGGFRGMGRGFGYGSMSRPLTEKEELDTLNDYKEDLKKELECVEGEIQNLKDK